MIHYTTEKTPIQKIFIVNADRFKLKKPNDATDYVDKLRDKLKRNYEKET